MSKGEKFIMVDFWKFPKQPRDNIYLGFTVFKTLWDTISFNSVLKASYFYRWEEVKWLVRGNGVGNLQIGIFNPCSVFKSHVGFSSLGYCLDCGSHLIWQKPFCVNLQPTNEWPQISASPDRHVSGPHLHGERERAFRKPISLSNNLKRLSSCRQLLLCGVACCSLAVYSVICLSLCWPDLDELFYCLQLWPVGHCPRRWPVALPSFSLDLNKFLVPWRTLKTICGSFSFQKSHCFYPLPLARDWL